MLRHAVCCHRQEDEGYNRLSRIEENLYTQEPHLAHLLQRHSAAGADMLAREKAKQLRYAANM